MIGVRGSAAPMDIGHGCTGGLLTREIVVSAPMNVDSLFQDVARATRLFGEGSQARAEANRSWHEARDAHTLTPETRWMMKTKFDLKMD